MSPGYTLLNYTLSCKMSRDELLGQCRNPPLTLNAEIVINTASMQKATNGVQIAVRNILKFVVEGYCDKIDLCIRQKSVDCSANQVWVKWVP